MDDKQRDVQKEKKIAKETKNNNSEKGEWRDKNSIERYKPPNEKEREIGRGIERKILINIIMSSQQINNKKNNCRTYV